MIPSYGLINETVHGPHWGVRYAKDDVVIHVGGYVGFGIKIIIEGKEYPLWQYLLINYPV